MLKTFRPTPTCTRFQTTIEMPCMKCGAQMRLATIDERDQNYDVLTYRCTPCDSRESFLKARVNTARSARRFQLASARALRRALRPGRGLSMSSDPRCSPATF